MARYRGTTGLERSGIDPGTAQHFPHGRDRFRNLDASIPVDRAWGLLAPHHRRPVTRYLDASASPNSTLLFAYSVSKAESKIIRKYVLYARSISAYLESTVPAAFGAFTGLR